MSRRDRDVDVDVTERALDDLATLYVALYEATAREGSGAGDGMPGRASKTPPIPIRPEVVDLIVEVERDVDRIETLIRARCFDLRRSMRQDRRDRAACGSSPDPRVLDALAWIRSSLPTVFEKEYGEVVSSSLWILVGKSRRVLGLAERVYRLETLCPYCELQSLIARPDRGLVVCGNPSCRDAEGKPHRWRAGDHLSVLTVAEGSS